MGTGAREAGRGDAGRGKGGSARLFVGTYTEGSPSAGLYALSLDVESGLAWADHTAMSNPNPSFLLRRGALLVAAHEVAGKAKAAVYAAHDDGSIEHISTVADTSGAGTCHVALHPNGRWVYGSNYESGSVSCWPLRLDGGLGPAVASVQQHGSGPSRCRQRGPHVHSTLFVGAVGEGGRFLPGAQASEQAASGAVPVLAVADLGADSITLYEAPADAGLNPLALATLRTPAGFGPRTMALRPNAPAQLAVVGELANAVIVYDMAPWEGSSPTPAWRELYRFDLPSCCGIRALAAHLEFSPCGRWLYASVRGRDVIAVYELDDAGRVRAQASVPCGGAQPRHFSLSPCGRYLAVANQGSNAVVVFAAPKPEDAAMYEICRVGIPAPACVIWGEAPRRV